MKALALAIGILALAALVPSADAGGPNCYDVYNEWEIGPITVVQYSSCEYDVCYEGRCGILR